MATHTPLVGAWESVIDHASLKVAMYLASSNTPFDTSTPLAKSMLSLLDHSTLRDVLVERNVSGLCGCFGCPRLPRGVTLFRQRRAEARTRSVEDVGTGPSQAIPGEQEAERAGGASDEGFVGAHSAAPHVASRVLTDAETAYMERPPRHRAGARRTIISSHPDACSCSDLDEEDDNDTNAAALADAEDADDEAHNELVRGDTTAPADHTDPEELVYEDDYFTQESFRLARRQEQQLARLRHRAELAREQRLRRTQQQQNAQAGGVTGVLDHRRGRHAHADMWERFCSLECEDRYLHELRGGIRHFRTYDHVSMRQAVAHLFPMLRPDLLQRLADADVASGSIASPIVAATVKEANDVATTNSPQQLKAVQTGVDYEAKTADAMASREAAAPGVGDVLREMQILGKVWGAEVGVGAGLRGTTAATPHEEVSREQRPSAHSKGECGAAAGDTEDDIEVLLHTHGAAGTAARPRLTGSLLVMDFLTVAAGETTHYLFFYHYCLRRTFLQAKARALAASSSASADAAEGGAQSRLAALVSPVLAALERKARALFQLSDDAVAASGVDSDRASAAWRHLLEVRATEVLAVNPLQQQPRRELFSGRYLSGETAAAVSRLLLVDNRILFDGAWHGVWMRSVSAEVITAAGGPVAAGQTLADIHASLSLVHSLRYRFAIPSLLLQPIGAAREPLMLTLTLVLSALCVSDSPRLWRELEMSDAEGALAEVLEAVGVDKEELAAMLMTLVVGEEATA